MKKEKWPCSENSIIAYDFTDPAQPFYYNSSHPEDRRLKNCPSKLDIPKIEKSNDN